MVVQNYPSGVILLPGYYRFPPNWIKLLKKGNFYPEHKVPKELRKNEYMQTYS